MELCTSRRDFLRVAGGALLSPLYTSALRAEALKPSSPVTISRCREYDRQAVFGQLQEMMDQLGGLARLVEWQDRRRQGQFDRHSCPAALGLPPSRTYHVHPDVVLATATLLDRAGAGGSAFLRALTSLLRSSLTSRPPAGT